MNAALFGIMVESGPVMGEVVPSKSSLSVNRGSYDSCSVKVVCVQSRSEQSCQILSILQFADGDWVERTHRGRSNWNGLSQCSREVILSGGGGLGERPCRESGVLRASSASRTQAICNCNVDIREWRLKVGIRLRFGIICRFVFIQVTILSSVSGRRGGDRCIGGAERGHHPSF